MAAALGDKALIEKICKGPGGWFSYRDAYVSDGRFYNEEFGKRYSMNGQVLMFGLALRNLGARRLGLRLQGQRRRNLPELHRIILGYPAARDRSRHAAHEVRIFYERGSVKRIPASRVPDALVPLSVSRRRTQSVTHGSPGALDVGPAWITRRSRAAGAI